MNSKKTRKLLRQWALWGVMTALVAILMSSMAGADDLTVDNGYTQLTDDATYDNMYVGATHDGQGVLDHAGANITVNEALIVGRDPGSNGVYNLVGGSLTASSLTASDAIVGMYGLGTFNQTAGSASVNRLTVGPLGEYNLQGGALNTGNLRNYGNFNLAGGALVAGLTDDAPEPVVAAAALAMVPSAAIVNDGIMQGYGLIAGSGGFVNNGYFAVTGPRGLFLTNSGTNVNNGTMDIYNILTLAPERVEENVAAASMALAEESEAALTNNGSMNLTKMAVVNGPGILANSATGTIAANGGAILSGFNNEGNLVVGDGGLNIGQGFTNTGTVELRSYAPAASLFGGYITNLGTITGEGQIDSEIINDQLSDPDTGTLTRGLIKVNAGETLELRRGLAEESRGDIVVERSEDAARISRLAITQPREGIERIPLRNLGNITVQEDALLEVSGDLVNACDELQEGTITVDGGTLEVTEVLTNESTLSVASKLKAKEVRNTRTGRMELGKAAAAPAEARLMLAAETAAPAVAETVVDAEFNNEGYVDILSATKFNKSVANTGKAAEIAINAPAEFADTVTNSGGKVAINASATFDKEVVNEKYVDPVTGETAAGILTVDAPATFKEKVTNNAILDLKEQAVFENEVENNGTVVAQEASVQQAYDGGTGVNTFKNLTIAAPAAYLKGAEARFEVSGCLTSLSAECAKWDTSTCELAFIADPAAPAPAVHDFVINGVDKGASMAGLEHNFAWDKLIIGEGQIINLVNGTADGSTAALYVRILLGLVFADGMAGEMPEAWPASGDGMEPLFSIANIIGNGNMLYYDLAANPDLDGQTFALLNGGELAPYLNNVPLPPSMLLLGSGLLGMGLLGWRRRNSA